jgi:hypothetical protein
MTLEDARTAAERNLLLKVYHAFNAREIETVISHMHADVVWPNGMEGGWVHGRDGVRAYWTRQFRSFNPHVEPVRFTPQIGRMAVDVHQVIRDLKGTVVVDQMVQHVYTIDEGLIRRMEIRKYQPHPIEQVSA